MNDLEKKSNSQLLDLKVRLAHDFEGVKEDKIKKYNHVQNIQKVYGMVLLELKNRNIE